MKMMKYYLAFLLAFTLQHVVAQETVSDEEIKKYAVLMDSINDMKSTLMESISEMVKNNEALTAARYNELSKIISDDAKLAEAKATPEEIAAIKSIIQFKDEQTAKIQETFKTMATEYVGGTTYNKVKKAISEDPSVKERYEQMMAEMNKEQES